MSKDFAFLFKPGDYLRDTQCLSEKVQVAYDRIMCEHMRNICITQQQLNFFTKRLNESELQELLFILNKQDEGFEIEWVAKSIRERIAYSDSRRNNRKGKSKKKTKNISLSYDNHMEGKDKDINRRLLLKIVDESKFILQIGLENLLLEWLRYKSEKGQTYKETGLKTLIKTFIRDSNSDEKIGREMLDYSMSKNYSGLFKEKKNENNSGNNQRAVKRVNDLWK